jgi:hypothetical protein
MTATIADKPTFRLEDFFAGHLRAWGIFQDRFGTLRQQFVVDVTGEWQAESGRLTIVEDFQYDTGKTEQRVWHVTKLADGHYEGHTGGLVGTADIRAIGNAVNLRYRLQVPIGDRPWTLSFDDWMFRHDDGVVINRAEVRKWGIRIGSATICFRRTAAPTRHLCRPDDVTDSAAQCA